MQLYTSSIVERSVPSDRGCSAIVFRVELMYSIMGKIYQTKIKLPNQIPSGIAIKMASSGTFATQHEFVSGNSRMLQSRLREVSPALLFEFSSRFPSSNFPHRKISQHGRMDGWTDGVSRCLLALVNAQILNCGNKKDVAGFRPSPCIRSRDTPVLSSICLFE